MTLYDTARILKQEITETENKEIKMKVELERKTKMKVFDLFQHIQFLVFVAFNHQT